TFSYVCIVLLNCKFLALFPRIICNAADYLLSRGHLSTLWKHDLLPVWHAGLSESTIYSMASESQSTSISCTGWTLPDSSPFIQSLLREVLQNQALPVLAVFVRASLLAYASIRMSLVFLSCTITGRSPLRFSKSMSLSDLVFICACVYLIRAGTEINLASLYEHLCNAPSTKYRAY